jgi:hypothetical protein
MGCLWLQIRRGTQLQGGAAAPDPAAYRLSPRCFNPSLPTLPRPCGPGGVVACRAGQRFFSFLTPSRHICWKMPGVPTVVSTPAVLRT